MKPAILFARADSVYKTLDCDVWDIERDARNYSLNAPVIAHPPCRAWGRLKGLAKPRKDEKQLALFAVDRVRSLGGVLEHPAHSSLWQAAGLPLPGLGKDQFGGWTLPIFQIWFGHRAEKSTFLYICGCEPADLPPIPYSMNTATHIIGSCSIRRNGKRLHKGDPGWRPEVSKEEREHTPIALAVWLLEVANRISADH